MDLKVRFRFNTLTGEVEWFEVDHEGEQRLSDKDHNATHEAVAAEIGALLERFPMVRELEDGLSVETNTQSTGETDAPDELKEGPEDKKEKRKS